MSDEISEIKEVAESGDYKKLGEWIEESAKLEQENHILRVEINRLNQIIKYHLRRMRTIQIEKEFDHE